MSERRAGALWPIPLLAGLLLLPAIGNGFPLVFPDSGTYLGIATGHDYAIDRSSVYGLLLRPFVLIVPGIAGLWLALVAQATAVAAGMWLAARALAGGSTGRALAACVAAVVVTALPWHAGQFMPDAFTGVLVLIACVAAGRAPTAPGAPMLWLVGDGGGADALYACRVAGRRGRGGDRGVDGAGVAVARGGGGGWRRRPAWRRRRRRC